jgi:uncharacterized protein
MPLKGTILEVNSGFISSLDNALKGDDSALKTIGISREILNQIAFAPPPAQKNQETALFFPTSVTLLLTERCTMQCSYCYLGHKKEPKDLPRDLIIKALEITAQNAKTTPTMQMGVHFHGGDISAAWELFLFSINKAKEIANTEGVKLNISVGINGVLCEEQARYIARHVNGITLSLDGSPYYQDRQRRLKNDAPSSERVLSTLRIFDEESASYGIRMTVTKQSVSALADNVAYIIDNCKASAIKAEPVYFRECGSNTGEQAPSADEFANSFIKAEMLARENGRILSYSGACLDRIGTYFCKAPLSSFVLTAKGYISSCYEITEPNDPLSDPFIFGTLTDTGVDIRYEYLQKLRTRYSLYNSTYCEKCFCKWHCAGDCPAKSPLERSTENDSLTKTDRCTITRRLMQHYLECALSQGRTIETITEEP